MTREELDNGIRTLAALVRKQEMDIAELQGGLVRARRLVEQLSDVVRELDTRIEAAEAGLRFPGASGGALSVDSIQRHRKFLAEQHHERQRVVHERQRAEFVEQEFVRKIAEQRVKTRVYENMAGRMRGELTAEAEKAELKRMDELWLTRTG